MAKSSSKMKTRIYARGHEEGMLIYVEHEGASHYVTLHRRNNRLFHYLRDEGRSIEEVKRLRPTRNKGMQHLSKSLSHILKLTDYVLAEYAA
ncbi:hypothetical protein [Slackia piriformis]